MDAMLLDAEAVNDDTAVAYQEAAPLQSALVFRSVCELGRHIGCTATSENISLDSGKANIHSVPLLLNWLIERDDRDEGNAALNPAVAVGEHLRLAAQSIGDDIIPLVEAFFKSNIGSLTWRRREGAIRALGCIVVGPSFEKLKPLVGFALEKILGVLKVGANKHLMNASTWTLRQIFEFQLYSTIETLALTEANTEQIVNFLLSGMTEDPTVAEDACYALYFLAKCSHAFLLSFLAPSSDKIIQSLCKAAHRDDVGHSRLKMAAYEALNVVILCASAPVILELVRVLVDDLRQTIDAMEISCDERGVQSQCRSLQAIFWKIGTSEQTNSDFMKHADYVMELLLRVFNCKTSAASWKEAMLAVGAFVRVTGPAFEKHMLEFCKPWIDGLQNFREPELYNISVDVMIDICRTLKKEILPYCDNIIPQLCMALSSKELPGYLKPPILSCCDGLVLAVGADFHKYLKGAMAALQTLNIYLLSAQDTEMTNLLKCGMLEAYSGILKCFEASSDAPHLIPFADDILNFLCVVCQTDMDARVIVTACVAVRDFSSVQDEYFASLIYKRLEIKAFLKRCCLLKDPLTKIYAQWAEFEFDCATYDVNWHDLEAKVSEMLLNAQKRQLVDKQANKKFKRFHHGVDSITLSTIFNELSVDEDPVDGNSRLVLCLTGVLSKDREPVGSRILAGKILLKALDTKDQWKNVTYMAKSRIRTCMLQTLSSSIVEACTMAFKVIRNIILFESLCDWPELVAFLSSNLLHLQIHAKQAALEALESLFQEVYADSSYLCEILVAVDEIIGASEGDNDVKLAAFKTLHSILDSLVRNRTRSLNCADVIRHVMVAIESPVLKIKVAAYECLVSISSACYENLGCHYNQFRGVTLKAMEEGEKPFSLLAIEFWSLLCYTEIRLTTDKFRHCFYYVKEALEFLVPILMKILITPGHPNQDDGTPHVLFRLDYQYRGKVSPNPVVAASRCLCLVAQTVGDDIVPLVEKYVLEDIEYSDLKQSEICPILCLAHAVGSILVGPTCEVLKTFVEFALEKVLSALEIFPDKLLKDAAAWTLRRIYEFQHYSTAETPIVTEATCEQVIKFMLPSLKDVPDVAENACYVLCFFSRGLHAGLWSALTLYFEEIVQSLCTVTQRNDVGKSGLRVAAYEALLEAVRCATNDNAEVLLNLVTIFSEDIHQSAYATRPSYEEREVQNQCRILQLIIQKLGTSEQLKSCFMQHVDNIVNLLSSVLACSGGTVCKEAMLTVGDLAYAIGPDFDKCMPQFNEYWEIDLQDFENRQVYMTKVSVIVDLCRVLKKRILPYCDGIMTQLLDSEAICQLPIEEQGPVISCIGEMVGATGDQKYLDGFMHVLQTDLEVEFSTSFAESDLVDETEILGQGILGAYSAIFQGFRDNPDTQLLIPFVDEALDFVCNFLSCSYKLDDMDYLTMKTAILVLEHLAFLKRCDVSSLIDQSASSKNFLEDLLFQSLIPRRTTHCDGLAEMTSISWTGYKLVELLAVHVKTGRPIDLYGTIKVNSTLGSQCIYKHEREDPERINPGDTALFINAVEEIPGGGCINFEADLMHRNGNRDASLDDEVCKGQLNWNFLQNTCVGYAASSNAILHGKNSSVRVSFVEFDCAVTACVRVSVVHRLRHPRKVHGRITAYRSRCPAASRVLFDKKKKDAISVGEEVHWRTKLFRGLLAAPLNSILSIKADLWEYEENRKACSPLCMGFADFKAIPGGSSAKSIPAFECAVKVEVSFGF